jgi:hypothetical protein
MDISIGALASEFAKGIPVALGMFLIFVIGAKGVWLWKRELTSNDIMWAARCAELQNRLKDSQEAAAARLKDAQDVSEKWRAIAMDGIGVARKLAETTPKGAEIAK